MGENLTGGLTASLVALETDEVRRFRDHGFDRVKIKIGAAGWPRGAFWPHGGHLFSLQVAAGLGDQALIAEGTAARAEIADHPERLCRNPIADHDEFEAGPAGARDNRAVEADEMACFGERAAGLLGCVEDLEGAVVRPSANGAAAKHVALGANGPPGRPVERNSRRRL